MYLVVGGVSYWVFYEIPHAATQLHVAGMQNQTCLLTCSTLADLNIWGLENLGLLSPLCMYLSALSPAWQH